MATIKNVINTQFTSSNADKVEKDVNNITRAQTRLGQSSAGASRQFAAQANGLGGLVGAYAGAAATSFALEAAFTALANSARALQTLEGLGALANAYGQNAPELLANIRDITKGQLTIAETAQQINLSLSAGFNTEQIEGLATVALKASRALGRDLSDSFTRVVRGSAKLETELLDELGIFTKIEPATAAYAAQLGKARLELTEYERRQGFVNAVIEEGNRKFSAINTTIPSAAEQIEAFGVKIIDIATQLGGFLANVIAPLAAFLTNNLAGAFATVGTVAGLIASKGISVLKGKLDNFADTAVRRGADVENFFLKYSAAAKAARDSAQQDIGSINLQKGIGGESQAQLKALKEAAKTRTLTGGELEQGIKLLTERENKLKNLKTSEEARLRDLEASKTKLKQETATLKANSKEYKDNILAIESANDALAKQTRALETTNTRLQQTTVSINVLQAATKGAASGIAKFASTTVTGFINLGSSIARTGANLVGFAGNALSVVSILSLVGASIAAAIGKQDEYNAVLAKYGNLIKSFFSSASSNSIEKGLLSVSAKALTDLESVDPTLKNIDNFRFSTKLLGVEIDVVKTKEDLIKEVTSALTEAAIAGKKTFGEQLSDNATGTFVGGFLGSRIGAAAGVKFGAAFGSIAGPLGTAAGAAFGAAAGFGISKFLQSDSLLSADVKQKLQKQYGADIFDGAQGKQLDIALQKIEEQVGAAKDLSFEGRKYYETQQALAIQLANNLGNIQQTQQIAEKLGIDLAKLQKDFEITVTDSNIKLSPQLVLDIPVTLTIIDQTQILSVIDRINSLIESSRTIMQLDPFQASAEAMSSIATTPIELPDLGLNTKTLNDLKNAFSDLAQNTYDSQLAAIQFESALTNLYTGVSAGSLSLETLAQAQGAVLSTYQRTLRESSEAQAALVELSNLRANLSKDVATPSQRKQLKAVDAQIAVLTNENRTLKDNLVIQQQRLKAVQAFISPYEEQLKVLDNIKKTFGDLVNEPTKKIGEVDSIGNFIFGEKNRQLAQYSEVTRMINESVVASEKLKQQEEAITNLAKGRPNEQALITQYSNITTEQFIKQNNAATGIAEALEAVVILTQEDIGLATQYNELLNVRANLTRKVGDELLAAAESASSKFADITADLNQQISNLNTQNSLNAIRFDINMLNVQAEGAKAAREFNIAFLENQIKTTELSVDLKKTDPLEGATSINTLEKEILLERRLMLDEEELLARELFAKEVALLSAEKTATIDKINLEAKQTASKIQAEYDVLVTAATTYNAISNQMSTAIVTGANSAGQALVDSAYAAAQTLASAFGPIGKLLGVGSGLQKFAFTPQAIPQPSTVDTPTGIKPVFTDPALLSAVTDATTKYNDALRSTEILRTESIASAEKAYEDELNLAAAKRVQDAKNIDNRKKLLDQEDNQALLENEKRLRDAKKAGSGGGDKDNELTYVEKKLQELFDSIKGNIESAIMSLNNLIFYGEGNFGDIMSNLFKSIQQDLFKTTIADPLSGFLTDSVFSALGITGMRTGIENAKVENGALLVKLVTGPADLFKIDITKPEGAKNSILSTDKLPDSTKGVFGGFFDQITSLFSNIFGPTGILSGLFKGLMGEGGILSGLFKGIGGFFTSLLGFSQGGLVHLAAGGAAVSASLNRDRIPAMLEPGEFVIRKQSASRIGMPALQAMNATGNAGGTGNVFVNVTNEGSPKQAEASAPRFDGEKYVIDVVMRDIANNGPIRRTLRGRGGL